MTTTDRDELAHDLATYETDNTVTMADALIAVGWRKLYPTRETRTEIQWGFKLPGREPVWTPSKNAARERAVHFEGAYVVTRTVIVTTDTSVWTTPGGAS